MAPGTSPLLTRLSAWSARHRWALDAGIVAAIVVVGTFRGQDEVPNLASALFTVALAAPLLWRRRAPVAAFALIAAVALVQWAFDVRAFGDAALLVALYTVAARCSPRVTLTALAVVEAGIVAAIARWASHSHPEDPFVALSGMAVAATVLGVNGRHRQAMLASLQARAARGERERIAREMHDIVAHNLSVMIALSDGATFAIHEDPDRAAVAMGKAARTGREALTEMRRLLGVLRDDDVDAAERAPQPGLSALDPLVDQVRDAGLPTSVTVAGARPEHVSEGLQLAAYRIVQEALTNVLKHGAAGAQASVTLRWDGPVLHLLVANSGPPVLSPSGDGGGLRGMRERAAVYDGAVTAGPAPGGGWSVLAQLTQAPTSRPLEPIA